MNIGDFFLIVFLGNVFISFALLLLWHILHYILCAKYDDVLFKEPYFRSTELVVYKTWPMSLFRTMGYIVYLAMPMFAIKKRFKGVKPDTKQSMWLVAVCKFFILFLVLDVLAALTILIGGSFA